MKFRSVYFHLFLASMFLIGCSCCLAEEKSAGRVELRMILDLQNLNHVRLVLYNRSNSDLEVRELGQKGNQVFFIPLDGSNGYAFQEFEVKLVTVRSGQSYEWRTVLGGLVKEFYSKGVTRIGVVWRIEIDGEKYESNKLYFDKNVSSSVE